MPPCDSPALPVGEAADQTRTDMLFRQSLSIALTKLKARWYSEWKNVGCKMAAGKTISFLPAHTGSHERPSDAAHSSASTAGNTTHMLGL